MVANAHLPSCCPLEVLALFSLYPVVLLFISSSPVPFVWFPVY